jgi:hypothetical protein
MAAMFSGASTDYIEFIESGCIMPEKSSFKPSILKKMAIFSLYSDYQFKGRD